MDDPILEEKLKNMFENRADKLPEDPGREARIRRNVYRQIEREGYSMKKGIMRKTVVALAAICVLGSMTAFAVGKITGVTSHSGRYDEVHTYEQALELQKKHGPAINFPKEFSNGYTFSTAVPEYYETTDDSGNKVGTGSTLSITYAKDGKENVTFSAGTDLGESDTPNEEKTLDDGTTLRFYKTINKFVPVNYELTEEDKQAQEAGHFNLAYGSDKVEIQTSYMVEWDMDDQGYYLFKFGEELSADEMFGMAEEIIDNQ